MLCNCGEKRKFYCEISRLKIFLKIEIYKIYRKINSWSKFEDRSPMKLMSKMQIKLENSLCNSRNSPIEKRRWLVKDCTRAQNEFSFSKIERQCCSVLLFCFCQLFDLFECHGQPRTIVKDQIDENKVEANWTLPFTQSMSCNSLLTGGRVFLFHVWFCTFC
jgi:hypothetical protein